MTVLLLFTLPVIPLAVALLLKRGPQGRTGPVGYPGPPGPCYCPSCSCPRCSDFHRHDPLNR